MDVEVIIREHGAPKEYKGSVLAVGSLEGCLTSVIQQSSEPEIARCMAFLRHVDGFSTDDVSCPLLAKSASAKEVERICKIHPKTGVALPELLFQEDSGAHQVYAADGTGTLRDVSTGVILYHGSWKHGMRHGIGKAAIYKRDVTTGELVYEGEYDGSWANGMRHGHGTMVEDSGSRYEGQWYCDMRHGSGVVTVLGGGVWRGQLCRDHWHGVGRFSWPHIANNTVNTAAALLSTPQTTTTATVATGGQSEVRHYEHGKLVATAPDVMVMPRSTSGMALTVPMQRVASAGALNAAPGFPLSDEELRPSGEGGDGTVALHFPVNTLARQPNAEIVRFLKHSTINDVAGGRTGIGHIIFVDSKDTVENCLTRMTENSVLSVPVYDTTAERFIAIIHLLDIFAFMLDLVAKKKASFSPTGPSVSLRETLAHQRRFACAPISEVLEMSSHITPTEFKPLPEKAPLIYAVQILGEGAHAVPILDASGKIIRMLTQADIIRFVAVHLDELGPMASMTVGDLGLGAHSENLVVAKFSDKAFDVFTALRHKNAPAAPVVDNYGAMTANVSFSDVKAIAKKANFNALQLPIHQFFTAIEKGTEVMSPSIYVKANTMLSSIVLTLAATKIHQLYFVDDALHPVGTVRVVDILKLFVKEYD